MQDLLAFARLRVRGSYWLRLLISAPLAIFALEAQSADTVGRSAAPTWVKAIDFNQESAPPAEEASSGVHYLLTDTQVRVDAAGGIEQFRRVASLALNQAGVEEIAHVAIEFDPAYQAVQLHRLDVLRAGKRLPRLDQAEINVLQREKDIESRIYDGRKTANVFVEDVRVGDIIDYAYTLTGSNPAFGGRNSGNFWFDWAVPVQRIYARLLWPSTQPLQLKQSGLDAKPVETRSGDWREQVWDLHQRKALIVENGSPNWYSPYGQAQWSAFADWSAVARWAVPLYRLPDHLDPTLSDEIQRIAAGTSKPTQRMLEALRLVQGEVRYLGIEIGAGSYQPSAPDVVFKRRFGDCKDKTLLLLSLLKSLGIEARAALVNTDLGRGLDDRIASPAAFDHVIVVATIGDRRYWLDPTRRRQDQDLNHLSQPDYERALIIDASTRGLTTMPADEAGLYRRKFSTLIDAQAGFDQPVDYRMTTVHEGYSADRLRAQLGTQSREETQNEYLKFYANYYPNIEVASAMTVQDDAPRNRITTVEHYRIRNFWTYDEKEKRKLGTFGAPDVDSYLKVPNDTSRKAPLGVGHPIELVSEVEALLPEDWDFPTAPVRIDDPAFLYEHTVNIDKRKLKIHDTYRSLADHVAAADTPRYAQAIQKARSELWIDLYKYDNAPDVGSKNLFNPVIALLALFAIMLWAALAIWLYRRDPAPWSEAPDPALSGIGGWLILPAIGVVLTPLRLLKDIAANASAYELETWSVLTTPGGAAYNELWAPLLIFELTANLGLLAFALLTVVLFFQKRRLLPPVYIGMLIAGVVVTGLDLALANQIPAAASEITPKDYGGLAQTVFGLAVWGSYFRVSRRVRSTFTRRWGEQVVSPASTAVPPPLPMPDRSDREDAAAPTSGEGKD